MIHLSENAIKEVRRRLDELESKLVPAKPNRTDGIGLGAGEGGLQNPNRLEVAHVDPSGNGSGG